MKKKTVLISLAVCAAVALAGAAASRSDSLISRSYLEGTYRSQLNDQIETWAAEILKPIYDSARQDLDRLGRDYLTGLGSGGVAIPTGWTGSNSFTAKSGGAGDTVILSSGSGLFWTEGTASADKVLVDVTDGQELSAGSALHANHRYLAVEETQITVTSQTASWAVEGIWKDGQSTSADQLPFTDVSQGSWYYDAVRYVYEKGLYNGVSDTSFDPNGTMMRGMFATVLYRVAGTPQVSYSPIFSDVANGMWYTSGVIWCGQNQIVNGTGDQRYEPNSPLSRQQIAAMLYRYAAFEGADVSARSDLSVYPDGDQVDGWASEAMSWAVAAGIIRGGDNNQLLPGNSATRAEVAIMVQRLENWLN